MKFNVPETKESFTFPVSNRYYSFLDGRRIVSTEYLEALKNGCVGIMLENTIIIQESPFCLNCILGESSENIFDIIETNKLYNLSPDDGTAFAVLYGDDYLFFKPNDSRVYYRSISTDKVVLLANSYSDFLSLIRYEDTEPVLIKK